MDIKPQSSFIPKKTEDGIATHSSSINFFSAFATVIFVVTVAGAVGIFGYNYFLKKKIGYMDTELKEARKKFQPALIAELARTDKRIKTAKEILGNHTSVSSLFDMLQALTLETIRFKTFKFGSNETSSENKGSQELVLEGVGRSYNSVTLQSDIFRKEKNFKNPVFSDLALTDSGDVTFKVKLTVDPSVVLYRNTLLSEVPESIEIAPIIEEPNLRATTTISTSTSSSTNNSSTTPPR